MPQHESQHNMMSDEPTRLLRRTSQQSNLTAHLPLPRAGQAASRHGRRWYSQQTVTCAQIFYFQGWLKTVASVLYEIGFPLPGLMQLLSARASHIAVWSLSNVQYSFIWLNQWKVLFFPLRCAAGLQIYFFLSFLQILTNKWNWKFQVEVF